MSDDPKPARSVTPRRTKDETRSLVLEVAARRFSRASYEAVSLDDIAAESGVRKANLLYHFTSKEQLWYDTVDHVFAEVERFYAEREGDGPDSWGGLERFVRTYFEACRLNPAYVLIPLIEGATANWRSEWLADRGLKERRRARAAGALRRNRTLRNGLQAGGADRAHERDSSMVNARSASMVNARLIVAISGRNSVGT